MNLGQSLAVAILGRLFRLVAYKHQGPVRPERLLVSGYMGAGDAIMLAPVLLRLRRNLPNCRITWLAPKDSFSTNHVLALKLVDDAIHPEDFGTGIGGRLKAIRYLFNRRFDGFMSTNHVPGWWLAPVLTRIPMRVGHVSSGDWVSIYDDLFNYPVQYAKVEHTVLRNLRLLRPFGEKILVPLPEDRCPDSPPPIPQEFAGLLDGKPYLIIHPGASPAFFWKCWPVERFGELADYLIGRGLKVVVLAGSPELPMIKPLLDRKSEALIPAVDTTGTQLLGLLAGALLLVGNDSGPAHLAAFLGVPTVTLFGPTDFTIYRPWGKDHLVVRSSQVRSPVYRFDDGSLPDPLSARASMEAIETQEVIDVVGKRIDELLIGPKTEA